LSSNLIALAFIGKMSRLGVAFYAFALILLPVLAFVGTVTFVRLVQSWVEDIAYAHRIGLVRSYYLRVAPQLEHRRSPGLDTLPSLGVEVIGLGVLLCDLLLALLGALLGPIGVATVLAIGNLGVETAEHVR
jgi:hypothetical protein